jgi:hypothetical protein
MISDPSYNRQGKFLVYFEALNKAIEQYFKRFHSTEVIYPTPIRFLIDQNNMNAPIVFIRQDKEFNSDRIK